MIFFSGHMVSSGIAGSDGSSMNIFSFLLFSIVFVPVYIPQNCKRTPLALQHLLFVNFINDGHFDECG